MDPLTLNACAAGAGALVAQLVAVFVITPLKDRRRMEAVAETAVRKALEQHEAACVARSFVGPVAPDADTYSGG